MGRFDTEMRRPPVRLSRAIARQQQSAMTADQLVQQTAKGAGNFGQREARFGNVDVRLVINKSAGPNTLDAQENAIPIGQTARKRGYPPITTLP